MSVFLKMIAAMDLASSEVVSVHCSLIKLQIILVYNEGKRTKVSQLQSKMVSYHLLDVL